MSTVISDGEKTEASKTIRIILENADRLAEDAEYLFEMERFSSAFAFCILAQEEYAKAFFLHLVSVGAIPWSSDVQRALRDHSTKQLLAMVMDFLDPDDQDFVGWLERRAESGHKLTSTVVDALNIIRHEKIPRQGAWAWVDSETDPRCDPAARRTADGDIDRKKQAALYVAVGSKLQATSNPASVDSESARTEL